MTPEKDLTPIAIVVAIVLALCLFLLLRAAFESFETARQRARQRKSHRRFLVERFNKDVADRILRGEVWKGATLEMMSESLGKPRGQLRPAIEPLGDSVFEFQGPDHVRPVEVHFRSGVVVSWRDLD